MRIPGRRRCAARRRPGRRARLQLRAESADARGAALQLAAVRSRAGQRPRRDPSPAEPDHGARADRRWGCSRWCARASWRARPRASSSVWLGLWSRRPRARVAPASSGMRDLAQLRAALTGPAAIALFDAPWLPVALLAVWMVHPMLAAFTAASAVALGLFAVLNDLLTRRPQTLAGRTQLGGAVARRRARPQGRGGAGHGHDRRPGAADRPTARQLRSPPSSRPRKPAGS